MLTHRSTLLSSIALGLLAYPVVQVNAQLTNAVCLTGFNWMTNSKGQPPCLVAAYLDAECNPDPTSAYIEALSPGDHYTLPATAVSECFCNTVFYSVIGACAFCQGDENSPYKTWTFNCTQTYTGFPMPIPPGTAVPSWAYQDVISTGFFNVTTAENVAEQNHPDSVAPTPSSAPTSSSSSSSSTSPAPTSFSPTSSFPAPSNSAGGDNDDGGSGSTKKKSNIGPIVGGVVGGVVAIVLIIIIIALLMKGRRSSQRPASAAFTNAQQPPPPPIEPVPWSPADHEKQQFLSHTPPVPEMPKVYNPDDPTTFPDMHGMDDTTLTTRSSVYDTRMPQNNFQPSRYNGIAEI